MIENSNLHYTMTRNRAESDYPSHPALTFAVPCYNVETHLPTMLAGLEQQKFDLDQVEFVFVIDGSPDSSERIIADWMKDSPFAVSLVVQENRGLSGARNTGVAAARGDFVSFPDPDDTLSPQYISEVLDAIEKHPKIDMFTTKLVRYWADGTLRRHPLDYRYTGVTGNKLMDLDDEPEMIHLHGGMVFIRPEILRNRGLAFEERLRRGFEDAHLIAKYLLSLDAPRYMLLPNAEYNYLTHPGAITAQADFTKYLEIIPLGYLDLLDRTVSECPQWLANLILYDLSWLFQEYFHFISTIQQLTEDQHRILDEQSRETLQKIGLSCIRNFRIANLSLNIRASWEHAASPGNESHVAVLRERDRIRGLEKISFHSANPQIEVSVSLNNRVFSIAFQKAREIVIFNRVWMHEQILWVDLSDKMYQIKNIKVSAATPGFEFLFDGRVLTPGTAAHQLNKVPLSRPALEPQGGFAKKLKARWNRLRLRRRRKTDRLKLSFAYRAGKLLGWRKKFAGSWVLIDRDVQANDNAEALYRYLASDRPDINCWFVLNGDSPDFKRLAADGFRIVKHRSMKHFCLMKEARVLASSMADQYVLTPFHRSNLPKTWSFVFLQHGVIHNTLHRWLNPKDIDIMLTSTHNEFTAIAGTPSPYKFSPREVPLTGLPRHDRLYRLQKKAKKNSGGLTRVLLMPTWRNYLLGPSIGGRKERLDGFFESRYVTEWSGFFNGSYMQSLLKRPDVEVILLPHPGIDRHWQDLPLPDGLKRISYVGDDIQSVIASASFVITDYSSQAFEGAFCGAPTAYFQFDRDEFFSGGHVASPGYFKFERDGFGPVCETRESLEKNLDQLIAGTHPQLAEYRHRIAQLYPLRDGKASERTTREIEKRLVPWKDANERERSQELPQVQETHLTEPGA